MAGRKNHRERDSASLEFPMRQLASVVLSYKTLSDQTSLGYSNARIDRALFYKALFVNFIFLDYSVLLHGGNTLIRQKRNDFHGRSV